MTHFSAAGILAQLDQSAEMVSGFPAMCNAHILYGKALLRAFLNAEFWMITFDVVGFRVDIGEFDYSIDYSSNIPGYERGMTGIVDHLTIHDRPELGDPWGNFEFDILNFTASLDAEDTVFSLTPADYDAAGIDLNSEMSTGGRLLRLLVYRYAERLFVPVEKTLRTIGIDTVDLELVCELSDWEHTSILSGKTLPSQIPFFQSLASGLEQGCAKVALPRESNTHWSNWVECDDLGRK